MTKVEKGVVVEYGREEKRTLRGEEREELWLGVWEDFIRRSHVPGRRRGGVSGAGGVHVTDGVKER